MGKYIKLFESHDDYEDYVESSDYIEPHVSYCEDDGCVQYNKMKIKFKVTNLCPSTADLYDGDNRIISIGVNESVYVDSLPETLIIGGYCNRVQVDNNLLNSRTEWHSDELYCICHPFENGLFKEMVLYTIDD